MDNVRRNGGIIRVVIAYGSCDEFINRKDEEFTEECARYIKEEHHSNALNYYQYQPMYIDQTEYKVTRVLYNDDQTSRTLIAMNGLRLVFIISGRPGRFSLPALMIAFVSGCIKNDEL